MMILICYDGSADAQAAIDRDGLLMPFSAPLLPDSSSRLAEERHRWADHAEITAGVT